MKLAILFWFYKDLEICKNRLKILKKYNPDLKIFGLYGGEHGKFDLYKKKLGVYLNNIYLCPSKDSNEKWIHGDLMILDWYNNIGKELSWDSIFVVQWDALILDSLENQFSRLKKDQIFISATDVLDKYSKEKWNWTRLDSKENSNYLNFKKYISKNYNYESEVLRSLFVFSIFPRNFFEKWNTINNKLVGMLEYKMPTYAKIFGFNFYEKDLGTAWFEKNKEWYDNKPINATGILIKDIFILNELKNKDGYRIFHPYEKIWKIN